METKLDIPSTSYGQAELFLKSLHKYSGCGLIFTPKKYNKLFIEGCAQNSVEAILKNIDYSTDSYVSVNTFAPINGHCNRLETSCAIINDVFIDLDLHDKKCESEELLLLINTVNRLIKEKMIPVPTFIINTGRGLALHYIYKEGIRTEDVEKVFLHKSQYGKIFLRLKELLKNEACVDTTVRDLSRVCRIPGTYNTNAGTYAKILAWNNVKYTPEELGDAFGLDNVSEVIQMPKKKQGNKGWRGSRTNGILTEISSLRPDENEYTPSMRYRANLLESWIEECEYECCTREVFLFILLNTYLSFMSKNEAAEAIREMNSRFTEPLCDTEVNGLIRNMVKRANPYPLTNSAISEKLGTDDWMQLGSYKGKRIIWKKYEPKVSKEERAGKYALVRDAFNGGMHQKEISQQLGINISTVSKITKTDYKERRKERDELVLKLYNSGMTAAQIAKEAGCCRRTVFNIVKSECDGTSYGANSESAKNAFFIYKLGEEERGALSQREDSDAGINIEETKKAESPKPERFASETLKDLYAQAYSIPAESNEKQKALDMMRDGRNVCLLGSGGTGKSYLINQFFEGLSDAEQAATLMLAYTGKAAKNLPNGRTIHSALRLSMGVLPNKDMKNIEYYEAILKAKRIIIDEIGVVRGDVFNHLMKAIRKVELGTGRRIQVIISGDFGQIRPVATPEDLAVYKKLYPGKSLYCFDSQMWSRMNFSVITLRHIERQNEPEFINALNLIKYGNYNALKYFNDVLSHKTSDTAVYLCPTNELVRMQNERAMAAFKDIKLYPSVTVGEKKPVYSAETLKLAVGMRVMATRNNRGRYQNGSVGTVTKLGRDRVEVLFDGDSEPVSVLRTKYDADGKEARQFPLQAAYAITVDKAQGLTFDEVNIIPGFFAPGQLYVALTRCRTLTGIHITRNFTAKDLITDEKALAFGIDSCKYQAVG